MATVHLDSNLSRLAGGAEVLTIDAARVHQLVAALIARYPALEPQLEAMAVAIDGEIHHDAAFQTLAPDAEVYFVPKIAGG
jgi:molybdopterin synthase sulfur carrier subunit